MGTVTLSGSKWLGSNAAMIFLKAAASLVDGIGQPRAATSPIPNEVIPLH